MKLFVSATALALGALGRAQEADSRVMPTVTITDSISMGTHSENDPVGSTQRPEWTSHRRFSTTRVYIQKEPWEVGFEQWWRARTYTDRTPKHLFTEELEIGLPYRMQMDVYYDWINQDQSTKNKDLAVELRWALADWGKIPLNPTLYGEYKFDLGGAETDVYEFKLLLGEDFSERLHWGLNVSFEREISAEKTNEFAVSQGLSYTVIDQVLSAGVEMTYKNETVKGHRGDSENIFNIGPSVQWRPTKNTHLDLVCTFGCTGDSPATESFVIFGFDFGGFGDSHYKPTAGFRN